MLVAESEPETRLAVSTDAVFAVLADESRALCSMTLIEQRLAESGSRPTTESVTVAVEKLRSTGRVEVWSPYLWADDHGGDAESYVILSEASARTLKLELVQVNVNLIDGYQWRSAGRHTEKFKRRLRREAKQEVERGLRVEHLPDKSSPDPARPHECGGRPEVLLGERLIWQGPAWADGWKGGVCPSCEGNRDVHRVLVEHGQTVWASAIGSRYCLVCDWAVGEERGARRQPSKRRRNGGKSE